MRCWERRGEKKEEEEEEEEEEVEEEEKERKGIEKKEKKDEARFLEGTMIAQKSNEENREWIESSISLHWTKHWTFADTHGEYNIYTYNYFIFYCAHLIMYRVNVFSASR